MRAKHILNLFPLGTKVRLVYDRFTVTPVATAFVFIALAHCIAQISLQAIAYSANTVAGHTVSQILRESNVSNAYAFVEDGILKICDDSMNMNTCQTITSAGVAFNADFRGSAGLFDTLSAVPDEVISRRDFNLSEISVQCVEALSWPEMILNDARREDVCFLVFQVWLLGISIVTILNESIPHLVTVLVTHAMSSTWSVFQVSRTLRYGGLYKSLVVRQACGGVNVLSGFWARRLNYFIPILVLNAVAFIISSVVSYRLFKVYAHRTFKRVGYSDKMNVLYLYVLTFSVALQLSAFFVICSSALWLDALSNGVLARHAVNKTANRIIFIHVCVWTLPWIVIGWTSVRREHRLWTSTFFIIGLFMFGSWISVFSTTLYREIFRGSSFFAAMTITSFVVLTVTLLLATFCRMNFGKGLSQYLKRQDLIDESSFVPVFLARKQQSTMHSIVFPDKPVLHSAHAALSNPRNEKQVPGLVQCAHIKAPGQSFLLDLERTSTRHHRGRRYCLRPFTMAKLGNTELVAIPEEIHSSDRTLDVDSSSLQEFQSARSEHSSRLAECDSFLNAWAACKDVLCAPLQSRASTPLPLWRGQRGSSCASIPLSYRSDDGGRDPTFAESVHSDRPRSSVFRVPTAPLQLDPWEIPSSSSLITLSSGPPASQAGRLGLPPSPYYLKTQTSR